MPWELITAYLRLPVFALVASRLSGIIMFQPVLGGYGIPRRVQLLLILGLAALVTPFVHLAAATPTRPAGLVLAMANELALGIVMGLTVRMCFLGLQMGGQLIAREAGLAYGQTVDPSTGSQQSIFSGLYLQLGVMIFLILGGHRVLLAVALDTFYAIPLLSERELCASGLTMMFDALTIASEMAIRVAAPALLTLFLVNAAMGFISRTVPQFNVLIIGFSIKGLIAFVLIAISLPAALEAFTDALELTVSWVVEITGT